MFTHLQTWFLSTILNNDQAMCERDLFAAELFWLRIAIYYLVQQRYELGYVRFVIFCHPGVHSRKTLDCTPVSKGNNSHQEKAIYEI